MRWSLFLIKWHDFWLATLLKATLTQLFSCVNIRKFFKNSYFEVQILENEIYSCFFMSKVIHSLLVKVKKKYWNFCSKRNMIQCKILIQLFPSWKLSSPTPIITRFGWVNQLNLLVIVQVYSNVFNICTKKKEVPESISGSCLLSLVLCSGIKRKHWTEMK